jgi:hypothetical protein
MTIAIASNCNQTVLLHLCEYWLPNLVRFFVLNCLEPNHCPFSLTNQRLQMSFLTFLGSLRRSYLSFITIFSLVIFCSWSYGRLRTKALSIFNIFSFYYFWTMNNQWDTNHLAFAPPSCSVWSFLPLNGSRSWLSSGRRFDWIQIRIISAAWDAIHSSMLDWPLFFMLRPAAVGCQLMTSISSMLSRRKRNSEVCFCIGSF